MDRKSFIDFFGVTRRHRGAFLDVSFVKGCIGDRRLDFITVMLVSWNLRFGEDKIRFASLAVIFVPKMNLAISDGLSVQTSGLVLV